MSEKLDRARDYARIALAGVRLFNGIAALFTPGLLASRLGVNTDTNPAIVYVFRLFGVRTVIIGTELLVRDGESLDEALRIGIGIHASDTAAAFIAGVQGQLPPRAALTATLISATNTALAIFAQSGPPKTSRVRGR